MPFKLIHYRHNHNLRNHPDELHFSWTYFFSPVCLCQETEGKWILGTWAPSCQQKKKKGANSKLKYEDTGIKDIQHAKLTERVKFNLSTVIIECGSFSLLNAGTWQLSIIFLKHAHIMNLNLFLVCFPEY